MLPKRIFTGNSIRRGVLHELRRDFLIESRAGISITGRRGLRERCQGYHSLLPASKYLRSTSARLFTTASEGVKPPTSFDFVLSTYDKAFKELLHDEEARNSLFRGFVDGTIQSSEIYGLPNETLKDKDQVTMDSLAAFLSRYKPVMDEYLASHPIPKSKKANVLSPNTLLRDLATKYFDPLCSLFPVADKENYMDFTCRLKDGSTVLVEMQLRTEPYYWNSRAYAYNYADRIYSSQLASGESWGKFKKVYALDILGGYHDLSKHAGTDHDGNPQVLKRYQLVNIDNPADKIPDLELIQILPQLFLSDHTKLKELGLGDDQVSLASEWLELFKAVQMKNKLYIDQVKDQGVKRAYSILGKKDLAGNYNEWREKYGPVYADNIVQEAAAARREIQFKAARAMKKRFKLTDAEIAADLDLTEADVSGIKID